mgnify:FL=1
MKQRTRKKWMRQYKRKMKEKDTWDLSYNFARYVLPRLKRFRQVVNGHPVKDDVKTMDDWYKVLDKIILAFDYIVDADYWWIFNPEYDYTSGLHFGSESTDKPGRSRCVITEEDWVAPVREKMNKEEQRRYEVIQEGLKLFAKWYMDLWW